MKLVKETPMLETWVMEDGSFVEIRSSFEAEFAMFPASADPEKALTALKARLIERLEQQGLKAVSDYALSVGQPCPYYFATGFQGPDLVELRVEVAARPKAKPAEQEENEFGIWVEVELS